MDLTELGDTGSGCGEEHCGCSNQECQWEEPLFGLIELVCVTVIYIPLMLFGLLGNILTILVVWLRPHMRSSTYLYLSSMAVSDLLILLLLPLDLYKLWRPRPWPFGDLACKLTMFLSECCTFCTILHITFLSLERYLAVCWPITAKTLVTRRRTRALIGCLWLGAAVSAAPVLVMVGVEEVGGEEAGLGGWREDGAWTGRDGGFLMGGGESGHVSSVDGGLEDMKWGEKQKEGWGEGVGEFGERKARTEERDERKQGDGGQMKPEKQADEEEEMEDEGEQQHKLKDEGGDTDKRECRCTRYAVSSGLLSAMMILSNLYFLVPLCILGLVYSLIGRTLWLRPQSSRRDQSHRHTVKMLGVIVLAFVLCWLPFHVGRTIFSLSLGSDGQEAHSDMNVSADRNINTVPEPISQSDADINTGEMTAHTHAARDDIFCDKNTTHTETDRDSQHLHVASHTRAQHRNTHTDTHTLTDMQNRTVVCMNSQNTNTHTPAGTNTVTPTDLDASFNSTYTHPDTHLYFLYYLSQYFNLVSSVLFYLSAAINPLLYNLMSARYRHAVHGLVHTHSHTPVHRLRTLTGQHSTTTL